MAQDIDQETFKYNDRKKQREDIDDSLFENILTLVGGYGRYQKVLTLSIMVCWYTSAFIYFAQIFITATPANHWCRIPELLNLSMEMRKNLSAPGAIKGDWDRCMTFDANWTEVLMTLTPPPDGTPLVPCAHGWEYDFNDIPYQTVATEINWVCDDASIVPTAQSIFYVGCVIGQYIFGWIADRFGRVPAVVATNLVALIGSVATIFTSTVWDFILCRFIVGLSFNTSFMILYVLVLEYLEIKYRTLVASLSFAFSYTIGNIIIPWMAYYIADWRILMWTTTSPMYLVVLTPWVLPESIQWLVSKGQTERAVKVLKTFEIVNRKKIPENLMQEFIDEERSIKEMSKSVKLRWSMIYLIVLFMGCGMVIDGVTRLSDSFSLSLFTMVSFHGGFEFVSYFVVIGILDRLGRRNTTSGSLFISSVVLTIALFVPEGIPQAVLALVSRFLAAIALSALFQWSAEVIPTPYRATGICILHMSALAMCIISTYVAYSKRVWTSLPILIFTVVGFIVAGAALALPETKGLPLPQTIDEGEKVIMEHSLCRIKKRRVVEKCSTVGASSTTIESSLSF